MKAFQAQVFDDLLDTGVSLYNDPTFNDVLGQAEELSIFAVVYGISGTAPTLTVQIEESPDQVNWRNKQVTPEINGVLLSLTTITTILGRDSGSLPSSAFVRLRFALGGTTPRAQVKAWITARIEEHS
jgi:hypothetical protein